MRCKVALLSLGCLLASGCADQQETIVVTHAPLWTDQGCIIDASIDAALLRGTLDVEWETPYLLPLAVLNNLSTSSSSNTELTNEVQLTDADVRLEVPQSEDILEHVSTDQANVSFNQVLSSISVAAGDRVGIGVEVIGRPASQAFNEALEMFLDAGGRVTVVAKVVIHGERSSGSVGQVGTVEAREFTFPIELCQGCLFTCSGCEGGACPAAFDGVHGGICGNAQDLAVTPTICELPEME